MQAQLNKMEHCPKFTELDMLCPVELMLLSQIITFMFIVAKTKGAKHGLKEEMYNTMNSYYKYTSIPKSSFNKINILILPTILGKSI